MGPTGREMHTSPSKFPSESHRPPPRPPTQPPGVVHYFVGPPSTASNFPTLTAAPAPTPVQKQGKNKLTMLNPVSLFLRRRSGQGLESLSDESLVTRRAADLDPSIRGLRVHDFSAPRESYVARAAAAAVHEANRVRLSAREGGAEERAPGARARARVPGAL